MFGSAPTNSVSNLTLYIDGVPKVSSTLDMNSFVNFDLSSANTLPVGAHLFEVRSDIVSGADRSFYFNLSGPEDMIFSDIYSYNIPENLNMSQGYANVFGPTFLINSGVITITQDTSFDSSVPLITGASLQKLAAFKFTAYNEDMKISFLAFTPNFAGFNSGDNLTNLGVFVNGSQVGSSYLVANSGTTIYFGMQGNQLVIPAGQTVVVELRGDIVNSFGLPVTQGAVNFNLMPGSGSAMGMSSGKIINTPATGGQTLTIATNNVAFATTPGFSASTKAPNSAGVKIGSFTLQNGNIESISVNQLQILLAGTMPSSMQLSNLTVKDSSTGNIIGSPIGNPIAGANNFNSNISIPINGTKVFDVYADLGPGTVGLTVIPSMNIIYRGNTTNLSSQTATVVGPTTTAGVTMISGSDVSFFTGNSPVSQLVVGAQTNFNIGTFNFKSGNGIGGASIKDITFKVATNTISSITVNGKTATVLGDTATVYNVGIVVPGDQSGINIPVSVSFSCVGISSGCTSNSPVNSYLQISSLTYNDGLATVLLSGLSVTTNMMYIVGSKPTLTVNSTQQTGLVLGAENKIGEVTISADYAGSIKVNKISFNTSNSGLGGTIEINNARLADGNTTIPSTSVESGCHGAGSCVISFGNSPNGYVIAAGTSKTFSLYATITGTPVASTVVSVSSSIVPSGFVWDDVVGGGTNITGVNIYNFPTNSYSIRQ
jgi:hypothetical protein